MRTCVGCRTRAAKATLLRVVAAGGELVPDPAGRLPGRGAHVHPERRCVDLADKRRAFPRALRLAGPLDVTPVREHVARTTGTSTSSTSTSGSVRTRRDQPARTTGPAGPGDESRPTCEQHPMSSSR